MEEYRLFLIILAVSLPAIGIEFLLFSFLKRKLWVYLVPVIALAGTIVLLFYTYTAPSEGFQSLGYLVMAMISGGIFLISLIAAVVFHMIKRKRSVR